MHHLWSSGADHAQSISQILTIGSLITFVGFSCIVVVAGQDWNMPAGVQAAGIPYNAQRQAARDQREGPQTNTPVTVPTTTPAPIAVDPPGYITNTGKACTIPADPSAIFHTDHWGVPELDLASDCFLHASDELGCRCTYVYTSRVCCTVTSGVTRCGAPSLNGGNDCAGGYRACCMYIQHSGRVAPAPASVAASVPPLSSITCGGGAICSANQDTTSPPSPRRSEIMIDRPPDIP